ncbi:hypothetical protein [Archangium gephyra]|uniref:hypothetical protein n=1 Tax=Archangium gephyra TaxID=48 RepID=UPI00064A325D|nr:hypothetical protein [Archangium gephyra]
MAQGSDSYLLSLWDFTTRVQLINRAVVRGSSYPVPASFLVEGHTYGVELAAVASNGATVWADPPLMFTVGKPEVVLTPPVFAKPSPGAQVPRENLTISWSAKGADSYLLSLWNFTTRVQLINRAVLAGTNYTVPASSLVEGHTYGVELAAVASNGSTVWADPPLMFSVSLRARAPVITAIKVEPKETGAMITWMTDRTANTWVVVDGRDFGREEATTYHWVVVDGLQPGKVYSAQLRCKVGTNGDVAIEYVEVKPGAAPAPVITAEKAEPTEMGAVITWTTDRPANSWVVVDGRDFGREEATTSHRVEVDGLQSGKVYSAQLRCKVGANGEVAIKYVDVKPRPPRAPVMTAIKVEPTETGAVITWTTDRTANTWVVVDGKDFGREEATTSHRVVVDGLQPGKGYSAQLRCKVGANGDVAIEYREVKPQPAPAPVMTAIKVEPTEEGAVISWTTDQPANSWVVADGRDFGREEATTSHRVVVDGLKPGKGYRAQLRCKVGKSGDVAIRYRDVKPQPAPAPVMTAMHAEPTEEGAVITWTTDRPTNSWVVVDGREFGREEATTSHQVEVDGLEPDTEHTAHLRCKVGKFGEVATFSLPLKTNPPDANYRLRKILTNIGLNPESYSPMDGPSYRLIDLLEDQPVVGVPNEFGITSTGPKIERLQRIYQQIGFNIPQEAMGNYNHSWWTICATRALMAFFGVGWMGEEGKDSDVGKVMWPKLIDYLSNLGGLSMAARAQQAAILRELQEAKNTQALKWAEEEALLEALRNANTPGAVTPGGVSQSPDANLLRSLSSERILALRQRFNVTSSEVGGPLWADMYRNPASAWLTSATALNFISYLDEHIPDSFKVTWTKLPPTKLVVEHAPNSTQALDDVAFEPEDWQEAYAWFVGAVAPLWSVFKPELLAGMLGPLKVTLNMIEHAFLESRSLRPEFGETPKFYSPSRSIYIGPAVLAGKLRGELNLQPSGPLEAVAEGVVLVVAYATLANADSATGTRSFGGPYLKLMAWEFFKSMSGPVALPLPEVAKTDWMAALALLTTAKKAYDSVQKKVADEEDGLQKQLAATGLALTSDELGKYVAAFRASDKHKEAFDNQAAAVQNLAQVLHVHRRTGLEQAANDSGKNAQFLYDALKIVANSASSEVVLEYLGDICIKDRPLQYAFQRFPVVDELALPAVLHTAARFILETDKPEQAWEQLKEMIAPFMSAKDHIEAFGDLREAWGSFGELMERKDVDTLLEKSKAWAEEGRGKKILAGVTLLYTLSGGFENLGKEKYTEAVKDFASGSKDLMETLACVVKTYGDEGRLFLRTGTVARFPTVAIRLTPYLGVIASSASLALHAAGDVDAGTVIAMLGDTVSLFGSCLACAPLLVLPGEAFDAVGTAITLVGDGLSGLLTKNQMVKEKSAFLRAAGITDSNLLKVMVKLERRNLKALRAMKFTPKQIQALALEQPYLVTLDANLEPLGRLLEAFKIGFDQFLAFARHVQEGAVDPNQGLFNFASSLEGVKFESNVTDMRKAWLDGMTSLLTSETAPLLQQDTVYCLKRAIKCLTDDGYCSTCSTPGSPLPA